MLLSAARAAKRQKARAKETESFLASQPLVITHDVWLQCRSTWIYATKRLGICWQHPDKFTEEISRLEKLRKVIMENTPNVVDGLTPEMLCPTFLEI
jgi:hypothetical protein